MRDRSVLDDEAVAVPDPSSGPPAGRPPQSMTKLTVALILSTVVSCKKDPEPAPTLLPLLTASVHVRPPTPSATIVPSALPMGVTWEDPSGWERLALRNPMRKATYRVPRAKGDAEDGELAVFYFGPGEGGGIDANVDRWIKQFQDVKPEDVRRADRSANSLRQHVVEVESGTYSSGMPGGPTQAKKGYAMIAGIVEAPSGSYFFKLTGPKATLKASRETFLKLLDSVKSG